MSPELKKSLFGIARNCQTFDDPSHDFQHVLRVTNIAEEIARIERADIDVIIPAALFHDVIVYQKNDPRSQNENGESADIAAKILREQQDYPEEKILNVQISINQCSFSKGIIPELLEARILQDADRLEATGAISIMRTFSSGGQMKQPFYDAEDPFREISQPVNFGSGLDLFYKRLLVVGERMHTSEGKRIARRRTEFLHSFLSELKLELQECGILEK